MSIISRCFNKSTELSISKEPANNNGKSPFINLRQIVKTFQNAAGEFRVLKGIDATFSKGEFIGVIGKSGSGKSTLINMITGIDRPTSGQVLIEGIDITQLNENQMAEWRGKNLGVVFQFFQLLPTLSLLENIMLPMDFCGMYEPRERRERAMDLLDLVEMTEHADKLPSAVSGGQQQRVAIARSLANDPPIIVADEPTGNLDSRTAESVVLMFEQLIQRGKTIVMVTHDVALAKRVNRTLLIADGEIVNEWVFKTLPTLSHQQMLLATHNLEAMEFAPGKELIQQDQPTDRFFIISEGEVEIFLKRPKGSDIVVTRMGPGQYVGEIELMRKDRAVASVRAAEKPVQAYALDRETFQKLISESDLTRKSIENTANSRLDENSSTRKGFNHAS